MTTGTRYRCHLCFFFQKRTQKSFLTTFKKKKPQRKPPSAAQLLEMFIRKKVIQFNLFYLFFRLRNRAWSHIRPVAKSDSCAHHHRRTHIVFKSLPQEVRIKLCLAKVLRPPFANGRKEVARRFVFFPLIWFSPNKHPNPSTSSNANVIVFFAHHVSFLPPRYRYVSSRDFVIDSKTLYYDVTGCYRNDVGNLYLKKGQCG